MGFLGAWGEWHVNGMGQITFIVSFVACVCVGGVISICGVVVL